jgi:hypothetical protein
MADDLLDSVKIVELSICTLALFPAAVLADGAAFRRTVR